jgi:hypothetical protein
MAGLAAPSWLVRLLVRARRLGSKPADWRWSGMRIEAMEARQFAGTIIAPTPGGVAGPMPPSLAVKTAVASVAARIQQSSIAAPQHAAWAPTRFASSVAPARQFAIRDADLAPARRDDADALLDDIFKNRRRGNLGDADPGSMLGGGGFAPADSAESSSRRAPVAENNSDLSWLGATRNRHPSAIAPLAPHSPMSIKAHHQMARATPPSPVIGTGTGLNVIGYSDNNFTTFAGEAVDANVTGSVLPGSIANGAQCLSMSWYGKVEAEYTGTYTFSASAGDATGASVTSLVVNGHTFSGSLSGVTLSAGTLTAGKLYEIRMDYKPGTNPASATTGAALYWDQGQGAGTVSIPTSQLYSANNAGSGLLDSYYTANFKTFIDSQTDAELNFPTIGGFPSRSMRWTGENSAALHRLVRFHNAQRRRLVHPLGQQPQMAAGQHVARRRPEIRHPCRLHAQYNRHAKVHPGVAKQQAAAGDCADQPTLSRIWPCCAGEWTVFDG